MARPSTTQPLSLIPPCLCCCCFQSGIKSTRSLRWRGKYQCCTQPSLAAFSAPQKPLGYHQLIFIFIFSCFLTPHGQGGLNVRAFLRSRLGLRVSPVTHGDAGAAGSWGWSRASQGIWSCLEVGDVLTPSPNIWRPPGCGITSRRGAVPILLPL